MNFRPLGVFLLLLAVVAKEVEVFLLGILHSDAEALAVLPDIALFAGDAMASIILGIVR